MVALGSLGWDQPDIARAFARAMASGSYDRVPHCSGGLRKALSLPIGTHFFFKLCRVPANHTHAYSSVVFSSAPESSDPGDS